jgi:hypothetical protein
MITLTQYENGSDRALHLRSTHITAITEAANNNLAWHPLTLVECKSRRYYVLESPKEIEDLIKEQTSSAEEKEKSATARIKKWQEEEAAWNKKKQEEALVLAENLRKKQEAEAARIKAEKERPMTLGEVAGVAGAVVVVVGGAVALVVAFPEALVLGFLIGAGYALISD